MTSFQTPEELQGMLMRVAKHSPTNQKIALYLEKNYLQVIFMTASELADAMGVSQGSVSRFFMMLGYRGYNDFLRSLQRLVSKQLTGPERLQYSNSSHKGNHHEVSQVRSILDVELGNLNSLEEIMQGEDYEAMVSMVTAPHPLILLSARMSATLLPYAAYILHKMRADVSVVVPGTDEWGTLELLDPAHTNVIAVAFPRYSQTLIQKCRALKKGGFSLCALTDSRLSPMVDIAAHTVCVPVTTASLFDIYSTPLAFLNLMLRDAADRMPQLGARIECIEAMERRDRVYFTK